MYLILIEPLEGGLGVVETMARDFFLIYWQKFALNLPDALIALLFCLLGRNFELIRDTCPANFTWVRVHEWLL